MKADWKRWGGGDGQQVGEEGRGGGGSGWRDGAAMGAALANGWRWWGELK